MIQSAASAASWRTKKTSKYFKIVLFYMDCEVISRSAQERARMSPEEKEAMDELLHVQAGRIPFPMHATPTCPDDRVL